MIKLKKINRRDFLITGFYGTCGIILERAYTKNYFNLDEYIFNKMQKDKIAGLSACIISGGEVVWQKSYGFEDIEKQKKMSMDSVLNIGSISKTITSTAIMQLWEQNKFKLDDNINKYLPFKVQNPFYPKEIITFRQLLTHTSSINDGSNYKKSYSCGDPKISLGEWLKEYLTPEGIFYVKEENFNNWKPGEKFNYSNIGFGLIGYLVEKITGISFSNYCQTNIFEPLGMLKTSWFLSGLNISNLAIPYVYNSGGKISYQKLIKESYQEGANIKKGFVPYCFYGFPNYPDGLLRTSVRQLSKFLIVFMKELNYKKDIILQYHTIQEIFSNQIRKVQLPKWMSGQGLGWNAGPLNNGRIVWGHSGSDPGISTRMHFNHESDSGIILFANSNADLWDLTNKLFEYINNR